MTPYKVVQAYKELAVKHSVREDFFYPPKKWYVFCPFSERRDRRRLSIKGTIKRSTYRAGEGTCDKPLTSPTDHEGVPYGYCFYTAFPLYAPLARDAPTPDAHSIPPVGRALAQSP